MKKVLTSLMAAVLFAGYAYGVSTVESYSTVELVEEINEALANPTVTTLTISGSSNGVLVVSSTGAVSSDQSAITNVLTAGMVLPAVDGSAITNMSAALLAVDGSAVTNLSAGNIALGGVFLALDGSALTNFTATVTLETGTGYDSTGVAITNSAGNTMLIVTNATVAINP